MGGIDSEKQIIKIKLRTNKNRKAKLYFETEQLHIKVHKITERQVAAKLLQKQIVYTLMSACMQTTCNDHVVPLSAS